MKLSEPSKVKSVWAQLAEACSRQPILAIVFVSLAAIVVNCYPIIFCGRSFVAPTAGVAMVYGGYPTLPGMTNIVPVNAHGSDTGATLIWGVPVGFIESRSVLEHGELPLWNRYSHAGDTLIGQAISMIGDPLQWIVILGHGSSLAWDVKFVAAKLLFCIGFGLLIRRLLGSLPLALLFAALGAYCGAFYFIYNHLAFFVFCYAPWILLSALEFLDIRSELYVRWGVVWLLINSACLNAGHVEPAVVLIGGLNVAALGFALAGARAVTRAAVLLVRLAIGSALFLAFTAPFWISFLTALQGAYTIHSEIKVTQFPFASLLGIFDDVFFRLPPKPGPFMAPAPGASFLIFAGCIYALVKWRTLKNDLFFRINTTAIVLWGGCVFGWVPASMLAMIPLLNRVGHTHTDFSYLLVIHLTIQCAYGFKCLAKENFRQVATGLLGVGLALAAITLLYCFGFEHGAILWTYYTIVTAGAFGAVLLFALLRNRPRIVVPGMLGVLLLGFVPQARFGYYNFDEQMLMVPGLSVVLNAPSPAIEKIQSDDSTPFRVVGAESMFWGDYAAVYGFEDIRSCAPLSNSELVGLLRGFPGMVSVPGWEVRLENPVLAHGLLNLLNVKYVLTRPTVSVQDGLGFRLAEQSDLGVLENLDVWPRAFFSDGIVSIPSTEEFTQYLIGHTKQPFIALTQDEVGDHPDLSRLQANTRPVVIPATNYRLLPNSTAFDVHATSAGIVCLTEGQAKDFGATANGEPQKVLTVNRAFKGIYIDKPGDYHIEFTYRPHHWELACVLFWAGVGVIVLLVAAGVRNQSKCEKSPQLQCNSRGNSGRGA